MHDLNTINRLNREAHGESIAKWRASGKHVVAIYAGLTLMSATPHDTLRGAAEAVIAEDEADPSRRIDILTPTAPAALTRDQSEDTGANFATVGDYLRHVTPPGAAAIIQGASA